MTWQMVTALGIICGTILIGLMIVHDPALLIIVALIAWFVLMWWG